MDRFLGGSQKKQEEAKKKGNELDCLEETLREKLYSLHKTQGERDDLLLKNGRSEPVVIKANVSIRELIKAGKELLVSYSSKIKVAMKKKKD